MTSALKLSKADKERMREEIELIEYTGFTKVTLLFAGAPFVYEAEYAGLDMCASASTFSFISQMLCPDEVRRQLNMYKYRGSTKEFEDKVTETARILLEDRKRAEEEGKRVLANQ